MFPHPSTIKREQNIFPLRMSLIENIKNRRPNIDISYLSCMLHLSVTDAVEPDPVDFFHSPSENLASPVTGKIFNITRPVCGFPGATFTHPAYFIYVCLKIVKQRPDRKGQPRE